MTRRVAWGECDPAGIYYAPRAVDYAVEAVGAWYEAELGLPWVDLHSRYGLVATFVRVGCDYLRPLLPSQSVQVRVWVVRVGRSSVTFAVTGDVGADPCFQVRLVACFAEPHSFAAVSIPADFRRLIESYQAACGAGPAAPQPGAPEEAREGPGAQRHGLPAGTVPFRRRQRVAYGDCDAAGVVYAPRVFDYAIEAVGEWYEEVLGLSWMELVWTRKQGAPWVTASCEYLRPLVPGQSITVSVRVTRLGAASLGFAVTGYADDEEPCFEASLAACFIDRQEFKTMRIPEIYRQRVESYLAACEALAEGPTGRA